MTHIYCSQLRDEIVENFDEVDHMPFCESNWKKLTQWKWNEKITDDQAQTLTSSVFTLVSIILIVPVSPSCESNFLCAHFCRRDKKKFDRLPGGLSIIFLSSLTMFTLQSRTISSTRNRMVHETVSMRLLMNYSASTLIWKLMPNPRKKVKSLSRCAKDKIHNFFPQ